MNVPGPFTELAAEVLALFPNAIFDQAGDGELLIYTGLRVTEDETVVAIPD